MTKGASCDRTSVRASSTVVSNVCGLCLHAVARRATAVTTATDGAWRKAVAATKRTHETLVKTVAGLPDSRLKERIPGKRYDFYHLLHGIAQHELYHAGQIAILKKALRG